MNYYILSGFNLNDNNRGSAALGYGAFSFLSEFHQKETYMLKPCSLKIYRNPFKLFNRKKIEKKIKVNDSYITFTFFSIWAIDYWIYKYIPILSQITRMHWLLKKIKLVAAINGGDGFSDIYGTRTFEGRLFDTHLAIKEKIPFIILPQTLGPFKEKKNLKTATEILIYASKIYVRDEKFVSELNKMGVKYELTKDLSFYMQPQKVDITILSNSVGLNVSGLCYSNKFRDLSGRFDCYPQLIDEIIMYFQTNNIPLYLIAHSYNYNTPEYENDDMEAIKDIYIKLNNKKNIYLIDENLTSPQIKYVISQFIFFIGTRMHSNFAAIYTNTPVFGLAYSYKYEGAFNYMGLNNNYASIIDLKKENIKPIVTKITHQYMQLFQ